MMMMSISCEYDEEFHIEGIFHVHDHYDEFIIDFDLLHYSKILINVTDVIKQHIKSGGHHLQFSWINKIR